MTIKHDVLNELNVCDGIKFKTILLVTEAAETSLSSTLTVMKKDGLIEQVEELYYLTDKGKSEISKPTSDNKKQEPITKKMSQHKKPTPEKDHLEPIEEDILSANLSKHLNKIKQQLNAKNPKDIQLKIEMCDGLSNIFSDDIKWLLMNISEDYKAWLPD